METPEGKEAVAPYQPPHRRTAQSSGGEEAPAPAAQRRMEAGGGDVHHLLEATTPSDGAARASQGAQGGQTRGQRKAQLGGLDAAALTAALERAAQEQMLEERRGPARPKTPPNAPPKFSKKVFVGGLPPDIDAEDLSNFFGLFGRCWVDWPHKAETASRFPPKGYAFVVFEAEMGVRRLLESCQVPPETDPSGSSKFYISISSPSVPKKMVQVRPWLLADAEFVADPRAIIDPRKTIFIGGVPRPLTAGELGKGFEQQFGGVAYAGIDTDAELRYPKGAGRVAFTNNQSYIAAIEARYVFIQHPEASKRVEVKPYVLDDQMCDQCCRSPAPYFCPAVTCLQYYCHPCWLDLHSSQLSQRHQHKPLVKEPGLSGEFQKLEGVGLGGLGGSLRGSVCPIPVAPRRLPHVRQATISPSRARVPYTSYRGCPVRSAQPQLRPLQESPRKLSASGSMLHKWTSPDPRWAPGPPLSYQRRPHSPMRYSARQDGGGGGQGYGRPLSETFAYRGPMGGLPSAKRNLGSFWASSDSASALSLNDAHDAHVPRPRSRHDSPAFRLPSFFEPPNHQPQPHSRPHSGFWDTRF